MKAANLSAQRQSVAFGGTASRLRRQTPGSRAVGDRIPPGGLGSRLDQINAWLNANCG